MVAPLMKHFFNVMYCPFLIKTYVAFPFYLSCFGLNKKRQLQQYQRKRQKQSHGSNYYLIEIQGPVTCKFSQTGFILSAWNSGKLVLIFAHFSSVPNMIYPAMLGSWYLSGWLLIKIE